MKRMIISIILALTALAPAALVAVPAYADCGSDPKGQVLTGVGVTGQDCEDNGSGGVSNLVRTIVNILSIIVGVTAVIMIIIAGLKFTTAGGDSNAVGEAKNTLIYALVGLIVAALAQFLVHFVLSNTK